MAEDLFKLEEQRYNFTRMLGEAKAKMDSSKVGSAAYKAAKKNYDTAKAALPGIESKIKKIKADAKTAAPAVVKTDAKVAPKAEVKAEVKTDTAKAEVKADKKVAKKAEVKAEVAPAAAPVAPAKK